MRPSTLLRWGATALILFLVGCGPSRVALRPTFWKEPQHKIGVVTLTVPKMAAYRAGNEGLLDLAINSAMAGDLETHLQTLDASRFETVADAYVKQLTRRGFDARRLPQPFDINAFSPFSKGGGEVAEKDLRPLAQREGIDLLVLLSLKQCGTTRPYYGFIPLGPPKAICVGKGELIDLKSNEIQWRAFPENDAATQEVVGEWDEPPDFRNVSTALNRAVTSAQVFLFKDFFGSPVPLDLSDVPRGPLPSRSAVAPPVARPAATSKPGCTDTPEFRAASPVEKKRILESCTPRS